MKLIDKLNTLLIVENEERSIFQIIIWWEIRRILYNVIILICGIFSLVLMELFVNLKPGEDLVEPFGIIFFGIVCNLFYSLGWFTEIFVNKSVTYGTKMFKTGLYFTLFWVILPLLIHIILWIGRGFEKMN